MSMTMESASLLSNAILFLALLGRVSGVPNQIYNLGPSGSQLSPCATIVTTDYCLLQLPDTGKHVDISGERWTLAGAKIENGCALTVQDCSGSYRTGRASLPPASSCTTANSVCCECNRCQRDFSLYENEDACAMLFEHEGCSVCNGFRLVVNRGDEVGRMDGLVDNKVSSVAIAPGCEMKFYLEQSFNGFEFLATGAFDLPDELNDAISSYNCTCPNDQTGTSQMPPATTDMKMLTTPTTTAATEMTTLTLTYTTVRTATAPATAMTLAPNPPF